MVDGLAEHGVADQMVAEETMVVPVGWAEVVVVLAGAVKLVEVAKMEAAMLEVATAAEVEGQKYSTRRHNRYFYCSNYLHDPAAWGSQAICL
mmetsp:Transcript_55127/g.91340  ORF Transcript_55127/g.91340 Transcript_55127/m.91340 type:complete len:92 (+) Transcript_55127:86-361(+)